MRTKELFNEMTMVDSNISTRMLNDYLEDMEPLLLKGTHIGDIEEFQLRHIKYKTFEVYGLCTKDEVVCVFKCRFKNFPKIDKTLYVFIMVTKPEWKGKSLSAKIINFFTTREVWNVLIDDLISPANKANLEKIAKQKQSSACWFNVKTGEISDFENADGKYKFKHFEKDTHWHILFQKRFKALDEDSFRTEEYYSRYWKKDSIVEGRMISGYEYMNIGTD